MQLRVSGRCCVCDLAVGRASVRWWIRHETMHPPNESTCMGSGGPWSRRSMNQLLTKDHQGTRHHLAARLARRASAAARARATTSAPPPDRARRRLMSACFLASSPSSAARLFRVRRDGFAGLALGRTRRRGLPEGASGVMMARGILPSPLARSGFVCPASHLTKGRSFCRCFFVK